MTNLILPSGSAPSSLRLAETSTARYVDGDLYNIGRRLQELHPSIYAVELTHADRQEWAIMENCEDGVQRLIFKSDHLDGRVIAKLGPIMNVPLEERVRVAEEVEARAKKEQEENEFERLYEELGRPMLTQLEHDGFIQRSVSYAKRGVKATNPERRA